MYITQLDLTTNAWQEIITLLSHYADDIVEAHIATAESTIEGYLSKRYNIRVELDKTGSARNSLLVNVARNLAIYNLYTPVEVLPDKVEKAYDRAIKMLEQMADGSMNLPGVPVAELDEVPLSELHIGYGSKPKRPSLD